MAKLSFEEFMKLNDNEKCIRYKDMNDYDKYRSRMTEPMICGKSIGYIELTKDQLNKGRKMIEEIIKMIEISRKNND